MSVWLEISRRCPDGRQEASGQITVRSAFQISQKFFSKLNCVWTVLPCRPGRRTLAAGNFHIKASSVQNITSVFGTVDLMHALSIYEARTSELRSPLSGRLNFECTTCLMDERVQKGIHIVRTVAAASHICVLERNPIADRTLSGIRTCC
jgi:hypothetical protein